MITPQFLEAGKATRFKKGQQSWLKGTKGKIVSPNKGKKMSVEARQKMSLAKKGKPIPHLHNPEVRKKISEAQKGEKNKNWKNGGVVALHDRVRNTPNYKQWRKEIFERDDYACVLCGDKTGGNLCVDHHPTALATILYDLQDKYGVEAVYEIALNYPKLWDTGNGRTLCVPCHKKTPTYGIKFHKK